MRILVTGASGFLGSAIVESAQANGLTVRAGSRSPSRSETIDTVRCDVLDPVGLPAALDAVHTVVHAAGLAHPTRRSPRSETEYERVNTAGTANLTRAAALAGVSRLVVLSSVSVYGGGHWPGLDERAPTRPRGPYGRSKLHAEEAACSIGRDTGLEVTVLRLATAYGPGDPGSVGRLVDAILTGHFLWVGRGQNLKTLIYRDDAARACVLAAVTPAPSAIVDVFNVTGCQHPVREIVETIAEVADRRLPAFRLPVTPARLAVRIAGRLPGPHGWAASLEQWLRDDCYSGERFAAAFGYSPHVGLTEGMRLTVASRRGKYTMTG